VTLPVRRARERDRTVVIRDGTPRTMASGVGTASRGPAAIPASAALGSAAARRISSSRLAACSMVLTCFFS
jgi:hypothetical protein